MSGAATVDKALDVLFHLHASEAPLALGEIARALGLAKSSCHRLLATLVQREVVEQDEAGRYRPGSRCSRSGSASSGASRWSSWPGPISRPRRIGWARPSSWSRRAAGGCG
ncbi:MAG: helix-turn-helix domain-containing protein [Myxococcota bacterium]